MSDVDAMHKALCMLVASDRQACRLLWRREPDPQPTALFQSTMIPSRSLLPSGFSMPDPTLDMTTHLASLTEALAVRYRITTSPTRDLRIGGRANTRRVSLPRADIPEWWQRKAAAAGLRLAEPEPAIAMGSARLKRGSIPVVRIDGIAHIADVAALTDSILRGVGRGKAYGCGLLTVQRLQPLRAV